MNKGLISEWIRNQPCLKNILMVLCPPVWHKLPPLGLAYISETLKSLGCNVDVLDLNIEDAPPFDHFLKYDCVGFSVFLSNQKNVMTLSKKIKDNNPKIKIIFGGPQCNSWQFEKPPDDIKYVDCIFQGDAIPSVNERAFPTFGDFKLNGYERKRALPIISSRGCIRKCRFCSERLLYEGFACRDPEKTIEEIKYHKKINNTKWFTFHDSLINGNLAKLENLCELMTGEDIKWDAQAIIRKDITERLLDKMKKSGCFNIFLGLESGSERMLKLMKKSFTVKDAESFFKKCKDVGLHFEVSLITGFPGEGEKEFNETLSFIRKNREYIPKIAQINPFIKYPGTCVENVPLGVGRKRVKKLINEITDLGIKYTPEFINNLIRGK
jgi:radical SAM superfamily enzyme YgiQ (UPF0313 family)